jgi:hypothetical protein
MVIAGLSKDPAENRPKPLNITLTLPSPAGRLPSKSFGSLRSAPRLTPRAGKH